LNLKILIGNFNSYEIVILAYFLFSVFILIEQIFDEAYGFIDDILLIFQKQNKAECGV
jgi:hypothetical protein